MRNRQYSASPFTDSAPDSVVVLRTVLRRRQLIEINFFTFFVASGKLNHKSNARRMDSTVLNEPINLNSMGRFSHFDAISRACCCDVIIDQNIQIFLAQSSQHRSRSSTATSIKNLPEIRLHLILTSIFHVEPRRHHLERFRHSQPLLADDSSVASFSFTLFLFTFHV